MSRRNRDPSKAPCRPCVHFSDSGVAWVQSQTSARTLRRVFLPLGTDRLSSRHRRRIVVVPVLLALNVAAYAAGFWGARSGLWSLEQFYDRLALDWRAFEWWNLITYQFLHDPNSMWHLLGNMFFLWTFGLAAEARLGRLRFLAAYLLGGAIAGAAQILVSHGAVIGASGSVSTVAGLFIALFPGANIYGLSLIGLGVVAIPASFFIMLYVAIDLVDALLEITSVRRSSVGNFAHLAGMAFGIALGLVLLYAKQLPRTETDLLHALSQWQRRRAFRAAMRDGNVWSAPSASASPPSRVATGAASTQSETERGYRAEIATLHSQREFSRAADRYRRLLADRVDAVLSAEVQIDLATQLVSDGDPATGAHALTLFIVKFPNDRRSEEVKLLLATVLARTLGDATRARGVLADVRESLLPNDRQRYYHSLMDEVG